MSDPFFWLWLCNQSLRWPLFVMVMWLCSQLLRTIGSDTTDGMYIYFHHMGYGYSHGYSHW